MTPRASRHPVAVRHPPDAAAWRITWRAALVLAGGDVTRLRRLDDGAVLVNNRGKTVWARP